MNPRSFVAENHREKITGNWPVCTLAMGVPQRNWGAEAESSPVFQCWANHPDCPRKKRSINVFFLPAEGRDGF